MSFLVWSVFAKMVSELYFRKKCY